MQSYRMKKQSQSGFTLVELAIVLVIIGLLVGGVLAGQDLIKAAKLQNAVQALSDVNTSATTFMTKYGQLPGDFSQGNTFTTPIAITGVANAVGLGDNNGLVQATTTAGGGTATATLGVSGETAAFFPELYAAGLLGASMAAVDLTVVTTPLATINATSNGRFLPLQLDGQSDLLIVQGFSGTASSAAGNYMFLVGPTTSVNATGGLATLTRALTPLSAQNIDTKLDDGNPGLGNVTALAAAPVPGTLDTTGAAGAASDFCATNAATSAYNIANKKALCTLGIKASF